MLKHNPPSLRIGCVIELRACGLPQYPQHSLPGRVGIEQGVAGLGLK
jgi:hypothetical protein